ncbi:MAG: hypothetical protein WCJ21_05205 [Planctomycetota bacterium]
MRLMAGRPSEGFPQVFAAPGNRRSRLGGGLLWCAKAVCLGLAGCTMCPDPFDYSGPVPNGAVTQNDFAARSNGIRPVRATPLPWPPLVTSAAEAEPTAEEPVGRQLAESGDAVSEAAALAQEIGVAEEASDREAATVGAAPDLTDESTLR